ncbi:cytochrome oxidase assembly protein ShyY1 [Motilibacter peucedani]|uniref:SURF1-like protein n=1 Tax=Motilibacter peucedani TaxID=598650 RepID=A0A420XT27_9ACTN|nr:SURF1 family protein [Motilibacter peucedani]RKS79964.1 cytochrome oxidase assembly protein ShyY1 [Motilibacter peucedani]
MGRNLWTTRLLPLHLGLVAALLACGWLGQWQYSRFTEGRRGEVVVRSGPALDLRTVLQPARNPPARATGQPVVLHGRYLPGGQLLLPDRALDGRRGFWLLAPVQVDGGAVAAVVRGWAPSVTDATVALPTGEVTVTGLVQSAEPAHDEVDTSLPPGQASTASPVELLDRVPGPMYAAIVVARSEAPPTAHEPRPVQLWNHRSSGGAGFRNFAYALQWWLFAAFAVFMWWRFLPLVDAGDGPEPDELDDDPDSPTPTDAASPVHERSST